MSSSSLQTSRDVHAEISEAVRKFRPRRTRKRKLDNLNIFPDAAEVFVEREDRLTRFREDVQEFHTDIYAHAYDPFGGTHLAIGTSRGYFNVVKRNLYGIPTLEQQFQIKDGEAISDIDWGFNGLSVATNSTVHFYATNDEDRTLINESPSDTIKMQSQIVGICHIPNRPERMAITTRSGRVSMYHMNYGLGESIGITSDHRLNATDCASSGGMLFTSGDGDVFVYDALRSKKAIATFHHEQQVLGIAASEDQSYLGVALEGSNTPIIYNLRTKAAYEPVVMRDVLNFRTIAFGKHGYTYWAGSNATLYCSSGINGYPRKMMTTYGGKRTLAINSIAIPPSVAPHGCVSVAGDSNSVIISDDGCNYWTARISVHVAPQV